MALGPDILFLTVRELGERIRKKRLSPIELTQSYLERSKELGARLNAYATITEQLALDQARQAETEISAGKYRGPLHGIPYAAKDLVAVRGYPTTWGATPYANQRFDYDATIIQKLNGAGAILIGKAAMIELAGGMGYRFASASHTGAAKNPWNEGCWTCGSSSGPAAIVSGALAAFAIGSETWGSIVCPSSFTGISGLRPTYGRVSRHGAMALSYSMDKLGPMARSTADCSLVLETIAGHDPLDPGSIPAGQAEFKANAVAKIPKLRIGWLTNAWKQISPGVQARLDDARAILNKFADVREAALPEGPWETAAGTILSAEVASAFEDLINSGKIAQLADPEGRVGGYINQEVAASDLMRANRIRRILQAKTDELFKQFDVLATASLPVTATKFDANLDDALSFPDPLGAIGNLCGLPGMSIPCGLTDDKLPAGLQFVAQGTNDRAVITAAEAFQQHTNWHKMRPPL